MELVGSDVKQYRNHNTTFKLTHVKKEEDKFWEKDGLQETMWNCLLLNLALPYMVE